VYAVFLTEGVSWAMDWAEVERSRSRGGRVQVVSGVERVSVVEGVALSWELMDEGASEEEKNEEGGEQAPDSRRGRECLCVET
jgi:hypothetical protein